MKSKDTIGQGTRIRLGSSTNVFFVEDMVAPEAAIQSDSNDDSIVRIVF